jgi:hypothetical protein
VCKPEIDSDGCRWREFREAVNGEVEATEAAREHHICGSPVRSVVEDRSSRKYVRIPLPAGEDEDARALFVKVEV